MKAASRILIWGQVALAISAHRTAAQTWTQTSAPVTNWTCVASSADGCRLVAVVNGGGIYTLQTMPVPILHIAPSAAGVLLWWVVPSMRFVLQETADLYTADWTNVAATPTLNTTRLQLQVTVPTSPENRFYRLVSAGTQTGSHTSR